MGILGCLQLLLMTNIRELYKNFIVKLQEFIYTIGIAKWIQIMSEYIDIRPSDILLDVGGNTGKITEAYSNNCKEVVVLEPKGGIVEYVRSHRPNIKFIQGEAENMPLPDEYFDKVVASASFHHFSDQDIALEEMQSVKIASYNVLYAIYDVIRCITYDNF